MNHNFQCKCHVRRRQWCIWRYEYSSLHFTIVPYDAPSRILTLRSLLACTFFSVENILSLIFSSFFISAMEERETIEQIIENEKKLKYMHVWVYQLYGGNLGYASVFVTLSRWWSLIATAWFGIVIFLWITGFIFVISWIIWSRKRTKFGTNTTLEAAFRCINGWYTGTDNYSYGY